MKKMMIIVLMTIGFAVLFTACGSGTDNSAAPASQEETTGKENNTGKEDQSTTSEPKSDASGKSDADVDADTDEQNQQERGEDYEESIEVMVPEGPVEEMVPQESVEIEIEEGQQGALG